MDELSRIKLEAAAFRGLVEHLQRRTDVQNIDLMNLSGFCRNCLSKWYMNAAADENIGIGGAFDKPERAGETIPVGHESGNPSDVALSVTVTEALNESDVLIDFTLASVCMGNIRIAAEAGKAVVLGTTGLSDDDKKELEVLSHSIPIVFAPNFSVGVNLLFQCCLLIN